MAHDVFISYSSKDKPIADAVCAGIEAVGVRCWIAPRDIAPGEDWPTAITRAISQSRIMVLVFSASSNSSEDVGRELILASNSKLVIIPFKIENIEPEPGKQYYLARTHWLDAMNPPTKEQVSILVRRVLSILPATVPEGPLPDGYVPIPLPESTPPTKGKRQVRLWPLWAAIGLVILAGVAWMLITGVFKVSAPSNPVAQTKPTYEGFEPAYTLAPTAAPPSGSTNPDFSGLVGNWSGVAQNGNFQMVFLLEFLPGCSSGKICAHFDIPSLPCRGDFTFLQLAEGMYQFQAENKIGQCGLAEDFLKPQEDGSLLHVSRGDFGENRGILRRTEEALFSADFNDPAFDGLFDSSVWTTTDMPWYSFKQADGSMVFKTENLLGKENGKLNSLQHWKLEDIGYIKARLKLEKPIVGEAANVAVTLYDKGTWWAGCGIHTGSPEPYIFCGQGENQQNDYWSDSYLVDYDKWYSIQVQFDASGNTFNSIIDGNLFYSWQPSAVGLQGKDLIITIGLWTDSNTSITGYVDDVVVMK